MGRYKNSFAYFALWGLTFALTVIIWPFLAFYQIKWVIGVLVVLGVINSLLSKTNLIKLVTIFLVFLNVHFIQSQFLVNPIFLVLTSSIIILAVGNLTFYLENGRIDGENLLFWLICTFLTGQLTTVLIYWPFEFGEKTLLNFIGFFLIYQLPLVFIKNQRSSIIAHLVFSLMLVMVVIGAILWKNYPQLSIF